MNMQWKTHAIGRHLVDVPVNAKLKESWIFDRHQFMVDPTINALNYKKKMGERERKLRNQSHKEGGGMLIERIHLSNDGTLFLYFSDSLSKDACALEAYYSIGQGKYIKNIVELLEISRRKGGVEFIDLVNRNLLYIGAGQEINNRSGFVMGDALLTLNRLNVESWQLGIELAGKPDVGLYLSSFVQGRPEPGLRQRAGGVLGALARSAEGLKTLRNRKRNVGPIEGDEILAAGTQNGKRGYAFKWEAPGKGKSLTEPNLNIELSVGESQYEDNSASFASDEEALALWDRLVSSIRLRPGAV